MATSTALTSTFNTPLTLHFRTWVTRDIIEQAYLGDAMLAMLQRDNEIMLAAGQFHVPVSFVDSRKGGSFLRGDTANDESVDPVTIAKYPTAHYYEPVKYWLTDEVEARGGRTGKAGDDLAVRYAEILVSHCRMRITSGIAADMAITTQASTKDILPLDDHITTAGTGAIGELNPSTNTSWANQNQSMGSFASNFAKLERLSVDCQKNGGTDWDWGVCDTDTFMRFKTHARTYASVDFNALSTSEAGKRTADMGIGGKNRTTIFFEGRPIIHDRHFDDTGNVSASSGNIFLINNNAFKLAVDPNMEFILSDWQALTSNNQHGRTAMMYWSGQTITTERSALGRAHTISD